MLLMLAVLGLGLLELLLIVEVLLLDLLVAPGRLSTSHLVLRLLLGTTGWVEQQGRASVVDGLG